MKQLSVRLKPNDHLREGIQELAKKHNVQAGVILSIVGGLENANLRMAGSTPNNQVLKEWHEPFEIISGTGTISPDGCHIHVALSDQSGNVIGGHLRGGCRVSLTAEIVLLVFDDVTYKREMDKETGFPELKIM